MVEWAKYTSARENRQTRGVRHLPRRCLFSRAHAYFSLSYYPWGKWNEKRWGKRNFRKRSLRVVVSRELKQQRRRRLRKRHLWSEFTLPQTLSRLFHLVEFVKCWQIILDLNFKGLCLSSKKEKESCCFLFTSSTKRETRHFHVLRNVQKSVMHMQSCWFANRVFSLTWPASMQICCNKRKRLHKKRVQLLEDWFGTPTWPPFHCFGTPIWLPWRHVKTLYKTCCFFAVLVAVAVVFA